jgi:protein involved in polysaccharide export with SLBB domain
MTFFLRLVVPRALEGHIITITHKGDAEHPEVLHVHSVISSGQMNQTPVYPGDNVFVSEAGAVFVVGAVGHSGAYVAQNEQKVTVLTSLALAGGPLGTAAMSKAKIVRESSQGIMVISLNLKNIMNQKTPDMVMKAGDVLVVPGSGLKDFTTKTIPGLSMGLTNVVTSALILQ